MRRLLLAVLACALVLVAAPDGQADEAPVPSPEIAPIADDAGAKGNAFNALPDGNGFGYAEDEYLVSGTAAARNLSPVALFSAGAAPEGAVAPYATRMLVRYPADMTRFNGTVVVEWLNVTSGYDVEAGWSQLHRQIVRAGYGYVGVTAQEVGAVGLKAFDAVRYAQVAHPGDQFSYDIFAQAVQAVRTNGVILAPIQKIIATGASQSGSTLNTYINTVDPQLENVIDGYLVLTATRALTPQVPVVRLLTEGEAGADHDDIDDTFREWEVAGATHTDTHDGAYFDKTHSRDWAPGWPLTPRDMTFPEECHMGSMPKFYVGHAALEALNTWIRGGPAAPKAPRIEENADGSLERDGEDGTTGNTVGGIRTPAIDAPTATYYGDKDDCAPTFGKTIYWTDAEIDVRYPTHAGYVQQVTDSANAAVAAGFLLQADADEIIAAAQASTIGGDVPDA